MGLGDLPNAVVNYRNAYDISAQRLGPTHPELLYNASALAAALAFSAKASEARELLLKHLPDIPLDAAEGQRLKRDYFSTLASLALSQGDLADAGRWIGKLESMSKASGVDVSNTEEWLITPPIARWYFLRGRLDEALKFIDTALATAQRLGAKHVASAARLRLLRSEVLHARGDIEAARLALDSAKAESHPPTNGPVRPFEFVEMDLMLQRADQMLETGQPEQARTLALSLFERIRAWSNPADFGLWTRPLEQLLGRAELALGHPAAALGHFDNSLRIAQTYMVPDSVYFIELYAWQGHALFANGDLGGARAAASRARKIAMRHRELCSDLVHPLRKLEASLKEKNA
jgi:tetratricopeptide (TPR) repeat protein